MAEKEKFNASRPLSFGSPADGYFYELQVSGVTNGFFIECNNVGIAHELVEFQDGNDPFIRKRPGRRFATLLTLKRPFDGDGAIWNWRKQIDDGNINEINDAALVAYDETDSEIARWAIFDAWPIRLVTEFDETGAGFEVLVLAYKNLVRVN